MVTGASSGLGAEVARTLAEAGAAVALVARRADRLAAVAQQTGGTAFPCDLSDDEQLDGLIPQVSSTMGPPTILVNVAGDIFSRDPAEREPVEAIRRTMDLNLVAPFRLCQDVFPSMSAAGRGAIVNVTSISGQVGIPGYPQASYAASKHGLSGLTAELAVQWGRYGIRANCVAPGFFRSEINDELYQDEQFQAWLSRNAPLPGHATFEDFTGAVHWLSSDAARHVTGQTIVVDGGWTVQ
ncbi:SDR family NAD(P)-dependent oxidoreductase [Nocardioides sp. LML1-1-1.1]|uniref:SDR family NAD(P)-dependent oxidoreductase n=1 Tax=Nocardioides sp. LML1-1-1.1 TaxID=3135248 RepID=UPI0034437F4B